MESRRNLILVVLVPLVISIALPATGVVTPQIGLWLLVGSIGAAATVILTPYEYRARRRLSERLPVAFRSPVYRKDSTTKPLRPSGPLGALDYELLMTQASERYGKILGRLTKDIERAGSIAVKYTPRWDRVASGSTEAKIAMSRSYANEQADCIKSMEQRAAALSTAGAEVRENTLQRLKAFPTDLDMSEYRESVTTLGETITESRSGLVEFRDAVQRLRSNNMQQAVNEVSDWQMEVLDGLVVEFDAMQQYVRDALEEMDRRNPPPAQNRAARRAKKPKDAST
jgi:hypothetical protein